MKSGIQGGRAPARWRAGAWILGALCAAAWVAYAMRDSYPLGANPEIDGRRASDWFREMTRTASRNDADATELRRLEARARLLRLGTNAVPFLVHEILRRPPEGPIHRALVWAAARTDNIFPAGAFPNPGWVRNQAREVLRELAPPALLVAEVVRPELEGNDAEAFVGALLVLSYSRNPDAVTIPWIRGRLARVGEPHRMAVYLNMLPGPGVTEAFPPTPELWNGTNHPAFYSVVTLLTRYGPSARAALPWLEERFRDPKYQGFRAAATALALLELDPEHAAARTEIESIRRQAVFSADNQLGGPGVMGLLSAVRGRHVRVTHPVTLAVLEDLAREEMDNWEPRGMAEVALGALERVAPERVLPLYLGQMATTNRPNIRIVAAGAALRLQRTNEAAIRFLADWLHREPGHLARMAAEQLGEASPRVTAAREALRGAFPAADAGSAARISLQRIENRAWVEAAR